MDLHCRNFEEHVSILNDLIKEKNPSSLGNVDVKNIDLWQVSFPIDDLETELGNINLALYPKLSPSSKKLTTIYTDAAWRQSSAADDCLHAAAKAPRTSRSSLSNHFSPL